MVSRKFLRKALFWLITWTIFNSLAIGEIIWLLIAGYYHNFHLYYGYAGTIFIAVYCLAWVPAAVLQAYFIITDLVCGNYNPIISFISWPLILDLAILLIFALIIDGGALWLWWRKQTIFRAFLLALAGGIASPALLGYLLIVPKDYTHVFFMSLCFYPFLGLVVCFCRLYGPSRDFSKFLFWRRPWD